VYITTERRGFVRASGRGDFLFVLEAVSFEGGLVGETISSLYDQEVAEWCVGYVRGMKKRQLQSRP
jgi:hypothetical protein